MATPFGFLSGFLDFGASLFASDEANRQANEILGFQKKVGESYDERIAFVKWQSSEEAQDYREALDALQKDVVTTAGANNLRVSGSVLNVMQSNSIRAAKDIHRMQLATKFEIKNLLQEKRLSREEAEIQADNLRRKGESAIIGGVSSFVSQGISSIPVGGKGTFLNGAFGLKRSS